MTFSWGRCAVPIAIFVVGLVLALAGLYFGDIMGETQLAAKITSGSWENDLLGIVTGGDIWGKVGLIFDVGSFLIFDVIIPGLSWYEQIVALGLEAAQWTPPGLAIHLGIAAVSAVIGMAGLVAEDCVPLVSFSLMV